MFCTQNLIGNILLFLPLELLLPLASNCFASAAAVVATALACSALIEDVQWAQRSLGYGRSVDVDDGLLNVLGAYAGYLLSRLVVRGGARGLHGKRTMFRDRHPRSGVSR